MEQTPAARPQLARKCSRWENTAAGHASVAACALSPALCDATLLIKVQLLHSQAAALPADTSRWAALRDSNQRWLHADALWPDGTGSGQRGLCSAAAGSVSMGCAQQAQAAPSMGCAQQAQGAAMLSPPRTLGPHAPACGGPAMHLSQALEAPGQRHIRAAARLICSHCHRVPFQVLVCGVQLLHPLNCCGQPWGCGEVLGLEGGGEQVGADWRCLSGAAGPCAPAACIAAAWHAQRQRHAGLQGRARRGDERALPPPPSSAPSCKVLLQGAPFAISTLPFQNPHMHAAQPT